MGRAEETAKKGRKRKRMREEIGLSATGMGARVAMGVRAPLTTNDGLYRHGLLGTSPLPCCFQPTTSPLRATGRHGAGASNRHGSAGDVVAGSCNKRLPLSLRNKRFY